MTMVLAPVWGWPVAIAVCAAMTALVAAIVIRHVRGARRRQITDETVGAVIRRTMMCLVIALVALTPSTTSTVSTTAVKGMDVVVAVDVTGSMGVSDAHYGSSTTVSRLSAAKSAVKDITSLYPDSSFAAIRFGSTASLDVPLTPDVLAMTNWADTLSVEPTSTSSGSSLDTPLDRILLTLRSIRSAHGHDVIVLYLITDGEQTASTTRRTYSSLRAYLDDAFVLGTGSTSGGRIPEVSSGASSSSGASQNAWVTDPTTGRPGVSKMDVSTLKAIADEMGGTSVVMGPTTTATNAVTSEKSSSWRTLTDTTRRRRTTAVVWPLAAVLALLLAIELGEWIRTSRRLL